MNLPLSQPTSYSEYPEIQPLSNRLGTQHLPSKHRALGAWIAVAVLVLVVGVTVVSLQATRKPTPLASDAVESGSNTTTAGAGTTSTTTTPSTQTAIPTTPTVAGVGASQAPTTDSGFSLVTADAPTNTPAGTSADTSTQKQSASVLGTAGVCTPGELFSIGAVETSERAHPADELNWSGALDVVGEYSNPFILGVTDEATFPWRTTNQNNATTSTVVVFSYAGPEAVGELNLGWSPGKHGDKAKRVLLDTAVVGTTPMRTGQLAGEWWEHMPRFVDTLPLTLTPGEHTLTLEHIADPSADAAVWDFISLDLKSCL